MLGLTIVAWEALWLVPYILLIRSVLREVQSLAGHVVPAVIFSGLMAPALFGGGDGVGFGPVALACLAVLTEPERHNQFDLVVYLAYWAVAAAILTAVTYSLRKKGSDFKAPSDTRANNPFD